MKKLLLFLALVGRCHAADKDTSLPELIARIETTAAQGGGINEEEQTLSDAIALHKTEAADQLIPLLKSPKKEIRQLASYCINELPKGSLLERHLPPLIEASSEERGWLPNAIADIGSEAAVRFLAEEFRRMPELEAQIAHALARTAPRSIPYLLSEFKMAEEDESEFLEILPKLWQTIGEEARTAVDPLLALALDENEATFRRLAAIACLGEIGPVAKDSFPKLKNLAEEDPETFKTAVEEAIRNSRTADAAAVLISQALAQTRSTGETYLFRDIALLGDEAKALGEQLVEMLDDPDPNVRLGACRTVGYTGRLDLWPHLARALKDPDWRVAFSACLSLGQLKAKGADDSLENLAAKHWYPRVRHAANYARARIQGKEPSQEDARHVRDETFFFSYGESDPSLSDLKEGHPALPPLPDRQFMPWGRADSDVNVEGTFKASHPELHAAISILPQSKRGGDFTIFTGLLKKGGTSFVALRAGEWVGGLFAVDAAGKASVLVDQNITELLEWNDRIVALSGTYHMGMDEGALHEVTMKDGKPVAKFIHALPGFPSRGTVLPDGRLFANCKGGAVAISTDGTFTYLGSGDGRPEE